jgi:acyl dehydratase
MNPHVQGRELPPAAPYLVGREKVREFARAVFSTSEINYDPDAALDAGYRDVVAPPTFPMVVQGSMRPLLTDPAIGIDFSHILHGEQRFQYSRPIVAGDELTTTRRISGVRSAGAHHIVTIESEVADSAGQHVATAVATLVLRGAAS